jgi:DNA excision repair protein ERCC-2
MRFVIEEVEVFFPYEYVYPEQYSYMCQLKRALDARAKKRTGSSASAANSEPNGCAGVLEMPSGTGKTVALLALLVAYQARHRGDVGKILYCSRTVAESEKVLEEARRVVAYRHRQLLERERQKRGGSAHSTSSSSAGVSSAAQDAAKKGVVAAGGKSEEIDEYTANDGSRTKLVLGVTSRRNLCVHERVSELKHGGETDAACRGITASWVQEKVKERQQTQTAEPEIGDIEDLELCKYYENFENGGGHDAALEGVFSHSDLRELGKQRTWCPYFLARHSIPFADVVVWCYQYVLDARIAEMVQREVRTERAIVIFDEAHNIDNVCIDALSIRLDGRAIARAGVKCQALKKIVQDKQAVNSSRLRREYDSLVSGLLESTTGDRRALADELRAPPVLPADAVNGVISGNIRQASHFLALMRRFLVHLKLRLKDPRQFISSFSEGGASQDHMETPLAFLQQMYHSTLIEPRVLQQCSQRLVELLNTLEISNVDEFAPLRVVADFATLVATYERGFVLLLGQETEFSSGKMHLCCLDASLAMRQVIESFRTVIITSGTLSPLETYPKILGFTPVVSERLPMTITRQCVLPLIVSKGADQVSLTSKHDARSDSAVVRNYGALLVDVCAHVPDGVVCFFPSYAYMEGIVSQWHQTGVLSDVGRHKLIFAETSDVAETSLAMHHYRVACDSGRGALLLAVSRGKVSEGIDFEQHYGRAVLCIGVPYQNTQGALLRARLEFLRDSCGIREADFLTFDAMRASAQCVGRVLRGKTDYGIMVFADRRFARPDKRNKLPAWVQDALEVSNTNLSTDSAASVMQGFLTQMSFPWTTDDQIGRSLWSQDQFDEFGQLRQGVSASTEI